MPHTVFIALGTNLGDRQQNLAEAIHRLGEHITVERVSSIYETPPWGITDQPAFLNQVICGSTSLRPHALLDFTQGVQEDMGRKADGVRYGPRLIDIDTLFYDQLTFASYRLTLPHPRLIERAFVLVPLADIAPDFVHPGLGCTVADLLERVDTAGIEPVVPTVKQLSQQIEAMRLEAGLSTEELMEGLREQRQRFYNEKYGDDPAV